MTKLLRKAIDYAFRYHYGLPLEPKRRIDAEPDVKYREIHGIMHAIGCMELIPTIDKLYRDHVAGYPSVIALVAAHFKLSEMDLLNYIQLAAIFHDSAREGEDIDLWEEESSINLYVYLMSENIPEPLTRFLKLLIVFKDDQESFTREASQIVQCGEEIDYLRHLLNMADTLEVMRVELVFSYKYLPILKLKPDLLSDKPQLIEKIDSLVREVSFRLTREQRNMVYRNHIERIDGLRFKVDHPSCEVLPSQAAAYEEFLLQWDRRHPDRQQVPLPFFAANVVAENPSAVIKIDSLKTNYN